VTLELTDPHGDVVATCDDSTSATGTSSYSESTEYGAPRTPAGAYDTYGWLGGKQRSSDDLAGLTLMGVRLYNPPPDDSSRSTPSPAATPTPTPTPTTPSIKLISAENTALARPVLAGTN
jgi:hypothetical protein